MVLVLVHEAGHFFTAKSFGIKVEEFGFGFPPKIFGWKYGETEYTFNLLPLGGFVKIFGENIEEADFVEVGFLDNEKEKKDVSRSFVHQARWKQALVLIAGVVANFLLAWILFSVSFMSGLPTSVNDKFSSYNLSDVNLVVVSVLPDSPAKLAGLETGDKIISLKSGKEILNENITTDNLKSFIVTHGKYEIEIGYMRGGDEVVKTTSLKPVLNKENKPSIGITMDQIGMAKLPFFTALKEGMLLNLSMTKNTALGLYTLIKDGIRGEGSLGAVTGPVGMVGIVGDAYDFGFVYLLSFAALISINLAIINILPFPALDGGRLLFLIIEKIKGSPLNPKIANRANMIGFSLLIIFMLFITYHDIVKLF